jgi:CRP-like cAMP-binding protein
MAATIDKNNIVHVSTELLKKLSSLAQEHYYTSEAELYYENHTPVVAYLILEGRGKLFKKRRKDIPLKTGDLIGLIELFYHSPSAYGAHVQSGTKVLFLDRSTINEIIEEDIDEDLKRIFQDLLVHA